MTDLVDFVVRADAGAKRGGDDVQVEHYVEELTALGFSTAVVPFGPAMPLRQHALVHLVNVDRPFEVLETARLAGTRPLVVSPVHHDPRGVRAMRAAERGRGLRSAVDRHLPDTIRELLASTVRTARSPNAGRPGDRLGFLARSVIAAPRLWKHVGRVLDSATAVALLAEGEGRLLRRRTGWTAENQVLVPNGRPPETDGARPWPARTRDLVMLGRIEPRKRQLETIAAAAERGLDLTVAGALQDRNSRFGKLFLETVARSPSVRYLGPLDHAATLQLLGDSRILVNASWVEVQSLVDIEASSLGCHVITSPAGHSAEWLGRSVRSAGNLQDVVALLDLAEETLLAGVAPEPLQYVHTWTSSTARLAEVYGRLESTR